MCGHLSIDHECNYAGVYIKQFIKYRTVLDRENSMTVNCFHELDSEDEMAREPLKNTILSFLNSETFERQPDYKCSMDTVIMQFDMPELPAEGQERVNYRLVFKTEDDLYTLAAENSI